MALKDVIAHLFNQGRIGIGQPAVPHSELHQVAQELGDESAKAEIAVRWLTFHRAARCGLDWPHEVACVQLEDAQEPVEREPVDWCAHNHPHEGDHTAVHKADCPCIPADQRDPEGQDLADRTFLGTDQGATQFLAQVLGDGQEQEHFTAEAVEGAAQLAEELPQEPTEADFWEVIGERIRDGKNPIVPPDLRQSAGWIAPPDYLDLPEVSVMRGGLKYPNYNDPEDAKRWIDRLRTRVEGEAQRALRAEEVNRRLKKRIKRMEVTLAAAEREIEFQTSEKLDRAHQVHEATERAIQEQKLRLSAAGRIHELEADLRREIGAKKQFEETMHEAVASAVARVDELAQRTAQLEDAEERLAAVSELRDQALRERDAAVEKAAAHLRETMAFARQAGEQQKRAEVAQRERDDLEEKLSRQDGVWERHLRQEVAERDRKIKHLMDDLMGLDEARNKAEAERDAALRGVADREEGMDRLRTESQRALDSLEEEIDERKADYKSLADRLKETQRQRDLLKAALVSEGRTVWGADDQQEPSEVNAEPISDAPGVLVDPHPDVDAADDVEEDVQVFHDRDGD